MEEPAREELSALAAIFCGPNEWEVLSRSVLEVVGNLKSVLGAEIASSAENDPFGCPRENPFSCLPQFLELHSLQPCAQGSSPSSKSVLENEDIFKFPWLRLLSSNSETDGTVFRILTKATGHSDVDIPIELVFHLPVNYPSCLPGLSIHSEHLTRAQCVAVKEKLLEQAQNLLSEPMVHELVLWLQQNLRHLLDQPETRNGSEKCALATNMTEDDGLWITLLHLDHMRAKTKYVRTVERWASDLKLTGRLMFMGKIILILLQGDRNSIKEYLILQKTSKVDVDSSGKKCKEKMISVLFETKVQTEHKRFLAFEVKEYSSLDELQKEFETAGLKKLFTEFVFGLVK